ncbi:MAG TPA: hypothetical protein VHY22_18325 [Chthoniobacteraceae bacterium]|jgi:carboxypeptidase C (cathepsin A)|nr:hypothetical protein [Chthoniobacteraceae bacterium]
MKSFLLLFAAVTACGVLHAQPAASPAPSATPAKATDNEPTRVSVTEHSITVNGQVLKYKATAGYITLSDDKAGDDKDAKPDDAKGAPPAAGKPKAKIFFVAYTREGMDPATRPVSFAFNGGPGAASVWLHLGQLGPRRLKLDELAPNQGPPYSLVDNDLTWLTDTDLVFIDPVSTGYSRAVDGTKPDEFHGVEEDIKSVGDFIRLYTTQNNRWLSPKLIVGESYGGTRAAGLAEYLQDDLNLYINGVIIVSGVMNWQSMAFSPANDIPYCLAIPSYASIAWYYKKDAPEYQQKDVREVRKEAEQFAMSDYLQAISKGGALPDADKQQIAAQLAKLTGVPLDYILQHNLRISIYAFREQLLKSAGRAPGRFDGRYSGIVYDPDDDLGDASFVAVRGAFASTINSYLRNELKFDSDLPYEILANVEPWKFDSENSYLDVAVKLGRAMTENPRMKVWILTGCDDLAVAYYSTAYTIDHMQLRPEIRQNLTFSEYESGHMIYVDQNAAKVMRDDFGRFLRSAVESK